MTTRCIFILFLAFSMAGTFVLADTAIVTDPMPVEKGVFSGAGQLFSYEKNQESIRIYDQSGKVVFTSQCPDAYSVILTCGYSKTLNSIYVIKEAMSQDPRRYDLVMETPSSSFTVVSDSPLAFYYPVLIEHNGFHVAYLADDFAIVLADASSGRVLQRIASDTPVRNLKLDSVGDVPGLSFDRFSPTLCRYIPGKVDVGGIGLTPCRVIDRFSSKEERWERLSEQQNLPRPVMASLDKDFKRTIGFGDSITYGYINKEPEPELGYIPRLLSSLRQEIYEDAELFNEGIGGSLTSEGVLRIDWVIQADKAQNLLFHYGTNDVLYASTLPVSEILFNITYMIDRVLEYGMTPVLSTLIPRNRIAADGIWLQRAIDVSEGIRELAQARNLPVVDFWNLFLLYPDMDGGYFSLMSDNVHPSEKGYQLMADEWLKILLALPPQTPRLATLTSSLSYKVLAQWPANEELDLHHYILRFGYQANQLTQVVALQIPAYEFAWFPFYGPSRSTIYFQLQAVDNSGNLSPLTPVQQIAFATLSSKRRVK